jgi:hypothetical protein
MPAPFVTCLTALAFLLALGGLNLTAIIVMVLAAGLQFYLAVIE